MHPKRKVALLVLIFWITVIGGAVYLFSHCSFSIGG